MKSVNFTKNVSHNLNIIDNMIWYRNCPSTDFSKIFVIIVALSFYLSFIRFHFSNCIEGISQLMSVILGLAIQNTLKKTMRFSRNDPS